MKIRVTVRTNKVGSDCETEFEIDDEYLKNYRSKAKQESYINELAKDAMFGMIEWNWEIKN